MLDINVLRKDVGAVADRLRTRGFEFDIEGFNQLEAERKSVQVSHRGTAGASQRAVEADRGAQGRAARMHRR